MALINCPDCGKEVSENAPACPKCGAPIAGAQESAGSGVAQLQTIQETSKKFKIHSLLAVTVLIIGCTIIVVAKNAGSETGPTGPLLVTAGLFWYCVNRFRIWWHHK